MPILYETYPSNIDEVSIDSSKESYEVPGYDGARVSKHLPPGKLLVCQYDDSQTMIESVERGCRVSENGQCLGWRSSATEYSWITYKEFMNRAINFGSGLKTLGIPLGQTTYIGIYATNSVEWVVAQYGSFYYSCPVVPLYDTIGPDARTYMINNAETRVIVCDREDRVRKLLEKSGSTPVLKHIIHTQDVGNETKELAKRKGVILRLFKEVEELGKLSPVPIKPARPEDIGVICYTSGTTGNPKGAILTHRNMMAGICGIIEIMGDLRPNKNDVTISYLPLAHIYEIVLQVLFFMHGGSVGFYSGNVNALTDDMKILKPTFLTSVPRVLSKIYDKVETQIKKLKEGKLSSCAADAAASNEQSGDGVYYDPAICTSVSASFGGRIRFIVCGAAPVSEKVLNFFRTACKCEVMEVYGSTELSGACNANIIKPDTLGSVGPPALSCMMKLVDVPELEYFVKDNIGEICCKGPSVCQGFLKDPKRTKEVVDEDGWLHTGDVGVWLPNGILKIVDRKKYIFKLAQGEYIMPEKIETVYTASSFITQILVHGDSLQNFLVAIVIPDKTEVMAWCKKNSISGTWTDICKNKSVKDAILEDMQRVAKAAGLLSFQQVKDIYLQPEVLTVEEGHLTPTQKTKRDIVKKLFTREIQAMYEFNNNKIV